MAWWFYLVVAAFVYIWLLTGRPYAPTPSVLALMGISAATGLAAAVVDGSKGSDQANQRTELEIEQMALAARIAEISSVSPPDGSQLQKELNDKKDRVEKVKASVASLPRISSPRESRGFLRDVMSDDTGISFHRFQLVVWTVVLGVVFWATVVRYLTMPDFDPTLLGLMGLSSGTYLGFKLPEHTKGSTDR